MASQTTRALAVVIPLMLCLLFTLALGTAGANSGYDPGYDVAPPWGQIDTADIIAVAAHWDTTGVYTSAHSHWGETWTGSGFGLLMTGDTTLPILRTYNSGIGAGTSGRSAGGIGVYGQSDAADTTKAALYGYSSEHAAGVYGESVHGIGVSGSGGDAAGDVGGYFAGYGGVRGVGGIEAGGSFSATTAYGVYGHSDSNMGGWFESAGSNHGLYGTSSAANKAGVYGYNTAGSGWGVAATGGARGVYGYSPAGAGGYFESASGTALQAQGNTNLSGNLTLGGSLNGGTPWTSVNDGAGSGLDADRLDGQQAADFAAAAHNHDDRYYTETEADNRYVNDNSNEVGNADVAPGALAPDKISGTAWTALNDGPGSGLNADRLDDLQASDLAPANHDHWGETWSGGGSGLHLDGSSASEATLVAANTGGAAALRLEQGGLSSDQVSHIWVPASMGHLYGSTTPALTYTDAGGVSLAGGPGAFDRSIDIPIVVPSVLYGQTTRVTGLRVSYKSSNGSVCITDTEIFVQTDADSRSLMGGTPTDRCSTTATYYDVVTNYSLTETRGPVWVRLTIHLEDLTSMTIGGVRLELAHD